MSCEFTTNFHTAFGGSPFRKFEQKDNLLHYWKLVKNIQMHVWDRWYQGNLQELRHRHFFYQINQLHSYQQYRVN